LVDMILVKLIAVLSKGLLFGVPIRTGQTMPMCFAQRVVSKVVIVSFL
jgi:hypothetical protein